MQSDTTQEKDLSKLTSKNDELTKQDASLRKEYTTLLRKMTSVISILSDLEPGFQDKYTNNDVPTLISEETVNIAPKLQWYLSLIHI